MANPHRGEVSLHLDGRDYTLRPSFHALAELESKTGLGIVALARKFQAGEFGIGEMAAVIWSGLSGADAQPMLSYDEVGEQIAKAGLAHFVPAAAEYLGYALGGKTGDA